MCRCWCAGAARRGGFGAEAGVSNIQALEDVKLKLPESLRIKVPLHHRRMHALLEKLLTRSSVLGAPGRASCCSIWRSRASSARCWSRTKVMVAADRLFIDRVEELVGRGNLLEMARLRVPTIATVTGEGGSGGALALAVADRVLMLENAIYTVISPEGCASIMWKDASRKQQAADALKYTAFSAKELGCVDDVLGEPEGGSHLDPACAIAMVDEKLRFHLAQLDATPIDQLLAKRYEKFRNIAQYYTTAD
jgi:hypothetical protein